MDLRRIVRRELKRRRWTVYHLAEVVMYPRRNGETRRDSRGRAKASKIYRWLAPGSTYQLGSEALGEVLEALGFKVVRGNAQ